MKISNKLKGCLDRNLFSLRDSQREYRKNIFDDNELNTLFLSIKSDKDEIEVPAFLSNTILKNIEISDNSFIDDIIIPLGISGYIHRYKTVDAILCNILQPISTTDEELRIINGAELGTFYGSSGLIMNKDKEVLLMSVLICGIENGKVVIKRLKLYVNPKVSIEDKTSIEKNIYTKVIPYCLTNTFDNYCSNYPFFNKDIEVVFKDVTKTFFITPNKPINTEYDDDIDNMLSSSVDSIVKSIKLCR